MPFDRPTLSEINARVKADIESEVGQQLPRSNLSVLGTAQAGLAHEMYGALDNLALALFPDTAKAAMLERHGAWWGVSRKPASKASGQVRFSGVNGTAVPAGLTLRRADDVRFVTISSGVISGGLATVAVEAEAAGAAGNSAAGTVMALASPVSSLGATVQVAAGGIGGGADVETDTRLLARLRSRVQTKSVGGSKDDFYNWTMEVGGVTRAWVYPNRLGPGTVGVTFLMDDNPAGPIPSAEDVALVQAYLDADHRRPVCCQVTVFACQAQAQNFSISNLAPNTAAVKAAIQAELADLIQRECEPEGVLPISHIREAISRAAGEADHVLVSPTANVTAATGKIITMGAVVWS